LVRRKGEGDVQGLISGISHIIATFRKEDGAQIEGLSLSGDVALIDEAA
jgi:hypothetical protein